MLRKKMTIEIEAATIIKATAIIMSLLVIFSIIDKLLPTLTLIATAFFLAIAINPAVHRLTRRIPGKSRTMATGISFVTIISILILFFSVTIPPIASQVVDFAQDLPATFNDFSKQDNFIANSISKYDLETDLNETARSIATKVAGSEGGLVSTFSKVTSTFINTLVVLVLTFMMLIEGPGLSKKFWELTDQKKLARRRSLIAKMNGVITSYVSGQLLITVIASSCALLVMVILGVPNALAMAGIVALFGLIPLIGTTLAASVVVLATLLESVKLAIAMAIFFLIYQQVENATIQPYIHGKSSSLSALTVFLAALIGVNIAGLFGAFVAVPVAGCLKIIIDDQLNQRIHNKSAKTA